MARGEARSPAARRRLVAAACALLLPAAAPAWSAADEPPPVVVLVAGAQRVVETSNAVRVAIGAPEVASVRALDAGRRLLVTGLAPGGTTLTVFHRAGGVTTWPVRVVAHDPESLRHEVSTLLQGIEGLSIRTSGDLVLLDGALHRASDRERVARVAALFPQARDLTRASPLLHRTAATRINAALAAAGLIGLHATAGPGGVVLDGAAGSAADLERAGRIAALHAERVTSLAAAGVPAAPMIGLDVRFVELSRASLAQVGIQWPGALPLGGTVSASVPLAGGPIAGAAGLTASFDATLVALAREGRARLLANPRLVTRSGESADFLAGGEIPIALVGERQSSLTWRPYGIQLECTPEADRDGRIAARLAVEVSTLDRANGVPEAPALATRRVRTAFTVRAGETIALSGLLSADAAKDVRRVPLLGRVPILGELFKSRAWQSRQTELVVFVTPTLREPTARDDREALAAAGARYRREGDALRPRLGD